jgi:large subunit ribosomal protein L17
MRHQKAINHLGRTSSHRKAMLSNMASSLIRHKRIHTTLAKAKALRSFIEPILTKSKEDSTHSRRIAFSYLQDKEAVSELFRNVAVKIADRPGGYTRILKTGFRLGDNADMCMMELVDFNESLLAAKEAAPKKTTRRRRSTGKKAETTVAEEAPKVTAPKAKAKAKAAPIVEEEKPTEPVAEVENIEPAAESENAEPDTPTDNQ